MRYKSYGSLIHVTVEMQSTLNIKGNVQFYANWIDILLYIGEGLHRGTQNFSHI